MTRPPQPLADDALLALLTDPRRRQILRHADGADGTTPVAALVESVRGAPRRHTASRPFRYITDTSRSSRTLAFSSTVRPMRRPKFEAAISLLRQVERDREDAPADGC